jgi:hypothetical protein
LRPHSEPLNNIVRSNRSAATNIFTLASGGVDTNPGNALDLSVTTSYYESEVGFTQHYTPTPEL